MSEPLSPEIAARLEKLRDIRLPEAVGWWPPAPGWWALLVLALLAVGGGLVWNFRRRRRARSLALRELERLDAGADPLVFATGLSVLLRRVALTRDPAAGTLQGADWSGFLSARGMEAALAAHLASAPYAANLTAVPAPEALRRAARRWIRRHA